MFPPGAMSRRPSRPSTNVSAILIMYVLRQHMLGDILDDEQARRRGLATSASQESNTGHEAERDHGPERRTASVQPCSVTPRIV